MIALLLFLIFYTFFRSSLRAIVHSDYPLQKRLNSHPKKTNYTGTGLVIISLLAFLYVWNVAGIFEWVVTLMTVVSSVILLTFLCIFSYKSALAILVISFLTEQMICYASYKKHIVTIALDKEIKPLTRFIRGYVPTNYPFFINQIIFVTKKFIGFTLWESLFYSPFSKLNFFTKKQ